MHAVEKEVSVWTRQIVFAGPVVGVPYLSAERETSLWTATGPVTNANSSASQ